MLKSRSRLEAILAAYRAERRIASVVYFTDSDAIRSAARHESDGGARRGVEVEYFEPAPEPDVERAGENLRAGGSER